MIDKQPGVWIYPDGREVIRTKTVSGRRIMNIRRAEAWRESSGICCLCGMSVYLCHATLEHKTSKGSGGAKHDDRQSNLGVSHLAGNVSKGSMGLEQYLRLPLSKRIANCAGRPVATDTSEGL